MERLHHFRVLRSRLDAGMERPWERTIKRNLLNTVRDERGKLVRAILTVLRAWHLAGATVELPLTGSFEEWSFRVRQPLVWLDYEDPWNGVKEVAADDPRRDELLEVIVEWKRALGVGREFRLQTVINTAMGDNEFYQALMTVAGSGKVINNVWAGRWLHRVAGKVVDIDDGYSVRRYKLVKTKTAGNYPHWALVEA
jgi:putative DNA primase/helicase